MPHGAADGISDEWRVFQRDGNDLAYSACICDTHCMQPGSESEKAMANLTIRRIDPGIKERLRRRAAEHGHSMEEEARRILSGALSKNSVEAGNAFDWLREPIADLGGAELTLPNRSAGRPAPEFD